MSEWEDTTLGNVIELKRGYDLPQRKRQTGSFPIVSSSGITDWHCEPMVKSPGVVTGRYGTLGKVYYITDDFWPLNTTLYVRNFKGNHPRFIFYFLKSLDFSAYSDKAAVPGLNRNHLHTAQIKFPPTLHEQKAIARILSSLDDKIELNRRMNETLEAMARAIFKDWFVDFGPTRAKQEGRPAYLPEHIWSLFPDAIDPDTGLPQGWELTTLGSIAESVNRTVNPAEIDEQIPYIGLEHMPRRSIALSEWEGAGKVTSNKLWFEPGEFLFGKLRPYFHKVGIAPLSGICSTDIVVVRAKSEMWSSFVLTTISTDSFVEYTNLTSTGTKMPRTSWSIMAKYELPLPAEYLVKQFELMIKPCTNQIISNIHLNRTLAELRDKLLPKLMSGEIRVKEAEQMVEEVT